MMATPTNFDPNNYQEFYQAALAKGEETARAIAAQTENLAKGSAMEQTRDQGFALGQTSKYGDTQNYREKIVGDIGQKAELERSKMLADQFAKEQANTTNQQSLLSTIGSALLQMKLAKEAAAKSSGGGGGGGYAPSQISADTLEKLGIGGSATPAVAGTAPTKKQESGFWKVLDRLSPALMAAGSVIDATVVGLPVGLTLQALGGAGIVAGGVHDIAKGKPAEAAGTATAQLGGAYAGKSILKKGLSLLSKLKK